MAPRTFAQQSLDARRAIIQRALAEHGDNRTAAAHALGLQRTYLQRLIRQFGLGQSKKRTRA